MKCTRWEIAIVGSDLLNSILVLWAVLKLFYARFLAFGWKKKRFRSLFWREQRWLKNASSSSIRARGQHSLYVKNIFSVWCSLKFLHFIASFLSFLVFSASRQFTVRREEGKSITNRECPVNALCSMACFLCVAAMRALIFDNASCNKRVEEPLVRSVSMWLNCG